MVQHRLIDRQRCSICHHDGYVFNGDSLVDTVEQQTAGGTATGTPQTRYIHPDHLGSTNVVTNASGTVVAVKDYYPYGSERVSTGQSTQRTYIGHSLFIESTLF
jgi:hypothetical protein